MRIVGDYEFSASDDNLLDALASEGYEAVGVYASQEELLELHLFKRDGVTVKLDWRYRAENRPKFKEEF